jgi:hypothetical protein
MSWPALCWTLHCHVFFNRWTAEGREKVEMVKEMSEGVRCTTLITGKRINFTIWMSLVFLTCLFFNMHLFFPE